MRVVDRGEEGEKKEKGRGRGGRAYLSPPAAFSLPPLGRGAEEGGEREGGSPFPFFMWGSIDGGRGREGKGRGKAPSLSFPLPPLMIRREEKKGKEGWGRRETPPPLSSSSSFA